METTPIMTTDGGSNFANGILAGATLNRGTDASALMASQFGNNWMNNPFAYMMFMAIFMNGGFGNNGNSAANMQLQNLQTQIADNHNSDLAMQAVQGNQSAINQLAQNLGLGIGQVTQAVSTVRDAITAANGNVQLAAQQMISNNNLQSAAVGRQMCEGFCGVQREILSQGYQNQIGNLQQSGLLQGIAANISQLLNNGFTQLGFQAERDACSVRENSTANTQRIIDTLNQHWSDDKQLKINQLESELNTQKILNAVASSGTTTRTTAA